MEEQRDEDALFQMVDELILMILSRTRDVREGIVLTPGPPPYRRLDCDGRALAYIRFRPRKRAVRVDISGLWQVGSSSPLNIKSAGGAATLLIKCKEELNAAVDYIFETIEGTRASYASKPRGRIGQRIFPDLAGAA